MATKNVCTICGFIAGVLASPWDYSICCFAPTEKKELADIPADRRRLNPVYGQAQGVKEDDGGS